MLASPTSQPQPTPLPVLLGAQKLASGPPASAANSNACATSDLGPESWWVHGGLDYMHARYCSPVTGRFLGVDRHDILSMQFGEEEERQAFREYIATPQSWNLYVYAKGNPVKFVDPNGEAAAAAIALPLATGGGGAAAGAGAAALAAPGAVILAGGAAGYGAGLLVNKIPVGGGRTIGSTISDAVVSILFATEARKASDFIAAKVATVYEHIRRYTAPNPQDPDDQRNKKNIGDRMRKHLEAARGKLKRLQGKAREQAEKVLEHAEQALEKWIAGGG